MGLSYTQAQDLGIGHLHPDSPTNRIVAATAPLPPPRMVTNAKGQNKGEAALDAYLEALRSEGWLRWYGFEPVALRLAGRTSYRPDFLVERTDRRMVALEYKGGHWRDDAKVKTKVVVDKFPWLTFFVVYRDGRHFRFHPVTSRGGVESQPVGQEWFCGGLP